MRRKTNLAVIAVACFVVALLGILTCQSKGATEKGVMTGLIIPAPDGNANDLLYTDGAGHYGWTSTAPSFAGGSITADCVMANGKYIKSDTTVAHTSGLALRDTTAGAYVPVVLMTNGTTNGTNAFALGYSSVPMTIASYGGLNVGATGNMTGIGTMSVGGDITLATTKAIQTSTTDTESASIKVRDVDGSAYRNVLSWTNGNTPAVVLGNANNSLSIASTAFNVSTAGAVSGVSGITFSSTSSMYMTVVDIAAADIKQLYTTPYTLVTGSAGNIIDIVSVDIFMNKGSTAYDSTSNTIQCSYKTSGGTLTACTGTVTVANLLNPATDTLVKLLPVAYNSSTAANIVGQNIVLNCTSADPATGDGLIKVAISYRVIATGF